MRSLKFPYSEYKGLKTPIIRFEIKGKTRWVSVWAYVDSGASFSIFSTQEAERLGIDMKQCHENQVTVGDGSLIPVYLKRLELKFGSKKIFAPIGFSPRLGVGFNLLGRQGIFENFDVTFSDSRELLIFTPIT